MHCNTEHVNMRKLFSSSSTLQIKRCIWGSDYSEAYGNIVVDLLLVTKQYLDFNSVSFAVFQAITPAALLCLLFTTSAFYLKFGWIFKFFRRPAKFLRIFQRQFKFIRVIWFIVLVIIMETYANILTIFITTPKVSTRLQVNSIKDLIEKLQIGNCQLLSDDVLKTIIFQSGLQQLQADLTMKNFNTSIHIRINPPLIVANRSEMIQKVQNSNPEKCFVGLEYSILPYFLE